jgi:hypothetical protein
MADKRATYLTSKIYLNDIKSNTNYLMPGKDPHGLWVNSHGKVYMFSKVEDARTVPKKIYEFYSL